MARKELRLTNGLGGCMLALIAMDWRDLTLDRGSKENTNGI